MSILCNEKEISIKSETTGNELVQALKLTDPHQGTAIYINDKPSDMTDKIKPGDTVNIY
jgi:sulfur carrier protein ThiS